MQYGFVLVLAAAVSWAAADAAAQPRGRGGYDGVTVYDDPGFRGSSATFRDAIADLRRYRLNDRITSLEISGNQVWEVCQDVNFRGRCRTFSGSIGDLRREGWNDRISSLRPLGGGRGQVRGPWWSGGRADRDGRTARTALVFYEDTNYRGRSRHVSTGIDNLASLGSRARSVEVLGGVWELCDGAGRTARCVTVDRDVPDLRRLGLRRGVESVREFPARRGRW